MLPSATNQICDSEKKKKKKEEFLFHEEKQNPAGINDLHPIFLQPMKDKVF